MSIFGKLTSAIFGAKAEATSPGVSETWERSSYS